ncbi:glycosyltransferase family 4 protein [Candidatus Peregrinibacteria bacterium CG10_big_fil_rev_8_21_14_0_10_49_24]|nr:MAG: glycosyl transferase [Candidatus Peregrinibacteria bacterium CG11_big_fil_rev_8_21_14_0_20_49_14]PIR50608.1 MAG: glycosyltransferase family 4 protein [Candidatus Peregrinibacteria bacterium CG10_big_fil_rev_8_21_14_0_10_49_24]PJA67074.1 MAG: glycosyltransferase family 4 protein [Candidatus Peregrinibacteria bacterium CG_4_9_14_3_um_filter_49_12]
MQVRRNIEICEQRRYDATVTHRSTPRIAIVADWLPTFGGAEHVIAEFCALWPDAPLYTSIANHGKLGPLDNADIRTTSLQRLYTLCGNHKVLLPLMPRAMEQIDLREFDVVISSSHAVAKGIIVPPTAVHICYCHTPMRYAWEMENEYLQDFRIPKRMQKTVRGQLRKLRRWDLTTANRTDVFLANSTTVQERIERIYGRKSHVVYPPVSRHLFSAPVRKQSERKEYFLALGRLVPYKRFDLLIDTANALGIPLKIAGTGQDFSRLSAMAGPTVELLGYVPDALLPDLYGYAKAFLFPQLEDAGVAPLEAQACGTPVIALGKGGALDTVKKGKTGIFFEQQSVDSLRNTLDEFSTMTFDPQEIRIHAKQFASEKFRSQISSVVEKAAPHRFT